MTGTTDTRTEATHAETPRTETTYTVLLHGDERVWLAADADARAAAYRLHDAFTTRCGERGHTIVGGAELTASTTSLVVRRDGRDQPPRITEGPYTETVEQLGGYYVISTADVQDLAHLVATLLEPGDVAEIRTQTTEGEDS